MGAITPWLPWIVGALCAIPCLVFVILTLRGRLALDDPYCGKCGHPLRGATTAPTQCPECGVTFKRIGGVKFARRERRVRWIVLAIVLFVFLPAFVTGGMLAKRAWEARAAMAASTSAQTAASTRAASSPAASQSAAQLITATTSSPLAITVGSEEWKELGRRVTDRSLRAEELDALLAALSGRIERMRAEGSSHAGGHPPDSAYRGYVNELLFMIVRSGAADESKSVPVLAALGDPLEVRTTPRVSNGGRAWISWNAIDDPGGPLPSGGTRSGSDGRIVAPIIARRLVSLRIDGGETPISFAPTGLRLLLPELPAGDHAVELDFETTLASMPEEKWRALTNERDSERAGSLDPADPAGRLSRFSPARRSDWERDPDASLMGTMRETRNLTISMRAPDQPLVDPLDAAAEAQQREALAKGASIQRAVIRPVGGPGKQTLQVRVIWTGRRDVRMLARAVVQLGDVRVTSEPKVLELRPFQQVSQGTPRKEPVIFDFDQVIDALPSDVGRVVVTIEPVATIPGQALSFDKGLAKPIELPAAELRRTDLGE